jgi:hypothetical protein
LASDETAAADAQEIPGANGANSFSTGLSPALLLEQFSGWSAWAQNLALSRKLDP